MTGWIDEVEDGMVYGRVVGESGRELEFQISIDAVPEDQRVDLEPGIYCTFLNGKILLEKTIWTTHEMEEADHEARHIGGAPK